MQVVLVMFRGDGQRRSFSVTRDVTVFGRREDSDFRIPLGDISRKHCRLVRDANARVLRIEDLGSSNGTFVNGARVHDAELHAGDTLGVGPVNFVVQINGEPAEEAMQPVMPPAQQQAGGAAAVPLSQEPGAAPGDGGEAVGTADDDEIQRILNADAEGSSIPGLPTNSSDSDMDALIDADSSDDSKTT